MVATQKDPCGHMHSPSLELAVQDMRGCRWLWNSYCLSLELDVLCCCFGIFQTQNSQRRIPRACKTHPGTNLQQSQVGFEGLQPWTEGGAEEMEPRGSPGAAWGMGRCKHSARTTLAFPRLSFCAHFHAGRAVFPARPDWESPEHWTRGE